VWDLSRGFDESLCNEWKCPKDQYQCLTGHCIPIKYVTSEKNQNTIFKSSVILFYKKEETKLSRPIGFIYLLEAFVIEAKNMNAS
jgi:hypothetical protein